MRCGHLWSGEEAQTVKLRVAGGSESALAEASGLPAACMRALGAGPEVPRRLHPALCARSGASGGCAAQRRDPCSLPGLLKLVDPRAGLHRASNACTYRAAGLMQAWLQCRPAQGVKLLCRTVVHWDCLHHQSKPQVGCPPQRLPGAALLGRMAVHIKCLPHGMSPSAAA